MRARVRAVLLGLSAVAAFLVSWVLRYNDPEGSFGGLTDDHMFYLMQGWQLLYGELPDRDFFDPGSPLTHAITAGLQVVLGRSVWSEYVFCVFVLALGAAAACVLAARATGSVLAGLVAAAFEIALRPRLYNYPKIAIYAAAIAAVWWWIRGPSTRRTCAVAAVTAVAFLLRHDHGLYVGVVFAVVLVIARTVPIAQRLRQAGVYAGVTLVLLLPYLTYLQLNGGVVEHFAAGARYSARDYDRTPLELPVPSFQPLFSGGNSGADWWDAAPLVTLERHYTTWWLYWLFTSLPFAALLLLWQGRRGAPWDARAYAIAALALLAVITNARLIRGNLDGRFADVAVPISVLAAWTLHAALTWRGRLRIPVAAVALLAALATAGVLTRPAMQLLRNSSLGDGLQAAERDAALVTRLTERTWPLDMWTDDSRGQIGLARYLAACTAPTDRVLMAPFYPPVFALAQRGFAGGRWDLRDGFFDTPREQQLTVERLQRQSVPIVIAPPADGAEQFTREFPIVAAYLAREYRSAGNADLGDGLTFELLVHRRAVPTGVYEPLALPCFN